MPGKTEIENRTEWIEREGDSRETQQEITKVRIED